MEELKKDRFPERKQPGFLYLIIYYPVALVCMGFVLDKLFFHKISDIRKFFIEYAFLGIFIAFFQKFVFGRKDFPIWKRILIGSVIVISCVAVRIFIEEVVSN
jgi:hypothetical protein